MSNDRALYEQVILDHNKNPRNYGEPPEADRIVEGINPLCGDEIRLYIRFRGDVVEDIRFTGHGCAISKSSASLMTSIVKGKTREEARRLFHLFHEMLHSENIETLEEERLGKLKVFLGVRDFPMRIKCATLAWHALNSGLSSEGEGCPTGKVSTE